jgi:hypothetical protein
MKNEFVAIVQEPVAVDRLVVADGQIFREPGGGTGRFSVDGDGFDPVNDVLQPEMLSGRLRDVERGPRVLRLGADVQEERTIGRQNARRGRHPRARPLKVVLPRHRVFVLTVFDAEVVWRRRDDDVHTLRRLLTKDFETVSEIEAARGARTTGDGCKGLQEDCHGGRPSFRMAGGKALAQL